ncbi:MULTISPECIES: FkbM family methyltransferase [Bradyrhizobium]|uniref:Methyltransferase n=3 Tax=Bradyrhizobium TaxID=374 RepID=A0A410VI07_9BRAD|nr:MULTISPECIES: FkbM family methyltransferase [Bradyrhizobium]MCG2632992.1 FkbM family methyltransferase [Bradyrhizobium zhengyangense]MCG2645599.1 FkbM family methyltransferase [Bradyrhizobium zhengyangense]MCG2673166.1 FkbM family methyltransferase [Bradyrhizobium zhengyangense]MDN4988431.1 FkbM family methyltransferase [Bradyrhizobium sp. WYCCWR 13022]MDN5006407.1 FkbM family methyltransferase [Bradyrhizobium sp. WYCCWR 12677]
MLESLPTLEIHQKIVSHLRVTCPVILDIGCNDGSDTQRFLELCPDASVYCFEPDPRAIARFKENKRLARPNVALMQLAISDRNGTIEFHPSNGDGDARGWDLSGSIRRPKNHLSEYDWVRFDDSILVETQRLDDWSGEAGLSGPVDLIWMDVQGAESDVIAGGQKTLGRTRFIYTEYSDRELYEGQLSLRSILDLLPAFEVVTLYPREIEGDVLLRNKVLRSV